MSSGNDTRRTKNESYTKKQIQRRRKQKSYSVQKGQLMLWGLCCMLAVTVKKGGRN